MPEGVQDGVKGRRVRMRALAIARPYSLTMAWLAADPRVRPQRSPAHVAALKRIGRLPPSMGETVDELGGTMAHLVWLASASDPKFLAELDARYQAIVAMLKLPVGDQDFTALRRSRPRLGRWRRWERRAAEQARASADKVNRRQRMLLRGVR